jgi:hypothetical protein
MLLLLKVFAMSKRLAIVNHDKTAVGHAEMDNSVSHFLKHNGVVIAHLTVFAILVNHLCVANAVNHFKMAVCHFTMADSVSHVTTANSVDYVRKFNSVTRITMANIVIRIKIANSYSYVITSISVNPVERAVLAMSDR